MIRDLTTSYGSSISPTLAWACAGREFPRKPVVLFCFAGTARRSCILIEVFGELYWKTNPTDMSLMLVPRLWNVRVPSCSLCLSYVRRPVRDRSLFVEAWSGC